MYQDEKSKVSPEEQINNIQKPKDNNSIQSQLLPDKPAKESNQIKPAKDKNQTKASALQLSSCSYIDLTAIQSLCGPGYKALVEKLEHDLHHSIFFDNISGNIIYAVHREDR